MTSLLLVLLLIQLSASENTSREGVEGSGFHSLPTPPLSRFSPNQSPIFIGGQSGEERKSTTIAVVDDKLGDEYYYDDEATGPTQRPIETMPVNPRTTMASLQVSETSFLPTTIVVQNTATFATLLVDEVILPGGPVRKTTRPPLKLVRLNDGEVIHLNRLKFHDPHFDEFSLKEKKKVDWRVFWQAIPVRRRTIVNKDVGEMPEDLPAFPPGAQLIHILQKVG